MNMAIKELIDKKKFFKRLLFVGGVLFFLFFIFGLTKEIVNRRQFDRRIADYEEKIGKIKNENSILKEKIEFWDKSTEFEGNARIKLGLEKSGEKTIIIIRDGQQEQTVIKDNQGLVNLSTLKLAEEEKSNPVKWWEYFFKAELKDNLKNND
jgi:cell division protein FtsB